MNANAIANQVNVIANVENAIANANAKNENMTNENAKNAKNENVENEIANVVNAIATVENAKNENMTNVKNEKNMENANANIVNKDCPSANVSEKDIKQRMESSDDKQNNYKKLALELHPDKNMGCQDEATNKMALLNELKNQPSQPLIVANPAASSIIPEQAKQNVISATKDAAEKVKNEANIIKTEAEKQTSNFINETSKTCKGQQQKRSGLYEALIGNISSGMKDKIAEFMQSDEDEVEQEQEPALIPTQASAPALAPALKPVIPSQTPGPTQASAQPSAFSVPGLKPVFVTMETQIFLVDSATTWLRGPLI